MENLQIIIEAQKYMISSREQFLKITSIRLPTFLQKSNKIFFLFFSFTVFYPYIVEKVFFFCQTFKIAILMDFHLLRSREYENRVFSNYSVCVPLISITQKQIIAETRNLVIYICMKCGCHRKRFMKMG